MLRVTHNYLSRVGLGTVLVLQYRYLINTFCTLFNSVKREDSGYFAGSSHDVISELGY